MGSCIEMMLMALCRGIGQHSPRWCRGCPWGLSDLLLHVLGSSGAQRSVGRGSGLAAPEGAAWRFDSSPSFVCKQLSVAVWSCRALRFQRSCLSAAVTVRSGVLFTYSAAASLMLQFLQPANAAGTPLSLLSFCSSLTKFAATAEMANLC